LRSIAVNKLVLNLHEFAVEDHHGGRRFRNAADRQPALNINNHKVTITIYQGRSNDDDIMEEYIELNTDLQNLNSYKKLGTTINVATLPKTTIELRTQQKSNQCSTNTLHLKYYHHQTQRKSHKLLFKKSYPNLSKRHKI
jgi:hypothetical protein